MQGFDRYNPITITVYTLCVSGIAMFCLDPVLIFLSLIGAFSFFFSRNGRKYIKSHFAFLLLFILMALINPLFSHNGRTVLFVINNSPITLEALIYGITASAMVISVIYWFRLFSQMMESDKLLYIFGKLSPKTALVLSMGLRYIPLFRRQTKKINDTQKALGLYKDDNMIDTVRGKLRVFSIMLTWALENGIVTADSMASRGYGIGRRTHFSVFRFKRSDFVLIALSLILTSLTCVSLAYGDIGVTFYPSFETTSATHLTYIGIASYALLVLMPTLIERTDRIKWKYLRSKN